MARRPGDTPTGAGAKGRPKADPESQPPSRVDRLVELVDHCTAAQTTADEMGERLLSYLLAMAIQESRIAIKREATASPPPQP